MTERMNIEEMEREARQRMFAFRNGIVADTLRCAGLPHEVIFGLNLPQISEIAKDILKDSETNAHELGLRLWADAKCRETRLLALRLLNPAKADPGFLTGLIGSIRSREEADVMRLWLMRRLPENPEAEKALCDKGFPPR